MMRTVKNRSPNVSNVLWRQGAAMRAEGVERDVAGSPYENLSKWLEQKAVLAGWDAMDEHLHLAKIVSSALPTRAALENE